MLVAIVAGGVAAWYATTRTAVREAPAAVVGEARSVPGPSPAAPFPQVVSRLQQLAQEIGPDAISPIAERLNAPDGSVDRDLKIVHQLLEAWQTNLPGQGNPVGDNAEITLALAGDNALRFAFVSPKHPAINANGELCDRWGTPFRLHALSGTQMEIVSAGADRRFGSEDDARFAPGGNPP